jgi:hypothetical protein
MTNETKMQARLALGARIRWIRKLWKDNRESLKRDPELIKSLSEHWVDEYLQARRALKEVEALGWT